MKKINKKINFKNTIFSILFLCPLLMVGANGTGNSYEATDRVSGEKVRTASRSDLVFGSNSQLKIGRAHV